MVRGLSGHLNRKHTTMALTPFRSHLIADVGISMGDEGKGRMIQEIIDEMRTQSNPAPVGAVVKVNGGANSGHTAGGLKLNLVPAGVIDRTVSVLGLGAGVVADPRKLEWELAYIRLRGHEAFDRLLIDQRTMVSDVSHRILDLAWEDYRTNVLGQEPRGSTGRGITPAYADECSQWPIFYAAFNGEKGRFAKSLAARLDRAERTVRHVCQVSEEQWSAYFDRLTAAERRAQAEALNGEVLAPEEVDFGAFRGAEPFRFELDAVVETYWAAGRRLRERVADLRERLFALRKEGRAIIGEFGQSYWLDKRFGFTPNLTASHTFTPEFFQSCGVPLAPIHTIGACKAYDTKVGTHVFISRIDPDHPLARRLSALEFGTSTGRQRMVGWFDAVEKGDCLRYGGFDDLMINKLDALTFGDGWSGGDLLICTAYRTPEGQVLRHVPRDPELHRTLHPVYQKFPGWAEDISHVRSFAHLPENARRYVAGMMASVLEIAGDGLEAAPRPNLRYLGVGPDPSQVIKDIPGTDDLLAMAKSSR